MRPISLQTCTKTSRRHVSSEAANRTQWRLNRLCPAAGLAAQSNKTVAINFVKPSVLYNITKPSGYQTTTNAASSQVLILLPVNHSAVRHPCQRLHQQQDSGLRVQMRNRLIVAHVVFCAALIQAAASSLRSEYGPRQQHLPAREDAAAWAHIQDPIRWRCSITCMPVLEPQNDVQLWMPHQSCACRSWSCPASAISQHCQACVKVSNHD